jgi:hypothetical protein
MRRKKYTDSELREIYRGWKASGESQQSYSEARGISLNLFKTEIYQLRKQEKIAKKRGSFHDVIVSQAPVKREVTPYCKITFSGEHNISFSDRESLSGLKSLIRSLIQEP